jgi:hypothetical protein
MSDSGRLVKVCLMVLIPIVARRPLPGLWHAALCCFHLLCRQAAPHEETPEARRPLTGCRCFAHIAPREV